MNSDPIRPAPPQPTPVSDAEAATDILRMLTSDRAEPMLRCRADGGAPVVN